MNNVTKYLMCSIVGANLPLLFGGVICLILSFLVWDISPLVSLWNAVIDAYTTHKVRGLIVSWFIFGNMLYLCAKGY